MTKRAQKLADIIKNEKIQDWVMDEYHDNIKLTDDDGKVIRFTSDDDIFSYLKDAVGFEAFERIEQVCNSDEMYTVIYFKESDIYLKVTGTYDSYGNNEHYYGGSIYEVKPISKTVIAYE